MSENRIARSLIVLNGDNPLSTMSRNEINAYDYVIAVDGALNRMLLASITPHAVVGDFDSVTPEAIEAFRRIGGEVDHREEQETSDFEKAVQHAMSRDYMKIDVIGFHGSRLDHILALSHVALKHASTADIRLIDDIAEGQFLKAPTERTILDRVGHICSVIPILPSEGVSLKGFQWPLDKSRLTYGELISCSNEVTNDLATISLSKGALFVYLHHRKGKEF